MEYQMISTSCIHDGLEKLERAKELAHAELGTLSKDQLIWKPDRNKWSIAQCLDHLVVSNSLYFPVFKNIISENYQMSFWERHSPFTDFC